MKKHFIKTRKISQNASLHTYDIKAPNIFKLVQEIDKDLVFFLIRQKVIPKETKSIFSHKKTRKYDSFDKLDMLH